MSIILDTASAQTGVKATSYVSGNDIHLDPRLTINEAEGPTWSNPCVKVSGVAGLRPRFIIPKANIRKTWYAGNGWFNNNGLWTQLGTPVDVSGTDIICQHDALFAQDTVWFSRARREGVAQIRNWIDTVLVPAGLIVNLSGGLNYEIGTYSKQIAEDGRIVAPTPLFGFRFGTGPLRFALTSGVHSCEDFGTTVYKKLIEHLHGSSAQAVALRAAFTIICLPLVNPQGREGGQTRSQFVVTAGNHNDLNRHFSDTSDLFETITLPRSVLTAELPIGQIGGLLDYHTQTTSGPADSEQFCYTNLGSPLESSFIAKYGARQASYRSLGVAPGGTMVAWAGARGAKLALVVEQNESIDHSDATASKLAWYTVLTLYDMLMAGDFATAPAPVPAPAPTPVPAPTPTPAPVPAPAPSDAVAIVASMQTLIDSWRNNMTTAADFIPQFQSLLDQLKVVVGAPAPAPVPAPAPAPAPTGGVTYAYVGDPPLISAVGDAWTINANGIMFRNGVAVSGWASRLARDSQGRISHNGGNNGWWMWNGTGWTVTTPPT